MLAVLDHLGDADRHASDLRVAGAVERLDGIAGSFVQFADHNQAGMVEVVERTPFAKEFRVHAGAEVDASPLSRALLQQRDQPAFNGAREHGAADDDDVVAMLASQRQPDLPADVLDVLQRDVAIVGAGRADTYQGQVAVLHRRLGILGRREGATADRCRNHAVQPRLDHGNGPHAATGPSGR